jgi:hypothetical protein
LLTIVTGPVPVTENRPRFTNPQVRASRRLPVRYLLAHRRTTRLRFWSCRLRGDARPDGRPYFHRDNIEVVECEPFATPELPVIDGLPGSLVQILAEWAGNADADEVAQFAGWPVAKVRDAQGLEP